MSRNKLQKALKEGFKYSENLNFNYFQKRLFKVILKGYNIDITINPNK